MSEKAGIIIIAANIQRELAEKIIYDLDVQAECSVQLAKQLNLISIPETPAPRLV